MSFALIAMNSAPPPAPESEAETRFADDVFGGLTVGEVVHPEGFDAHLCPDDSLGDLADALATTGRTAVGVTSLDHDVVGIATVNDVMRAYFEGVVASTKLSVWLQCSGARAPDELLKRLQVGPDAFLSEVAGKMVSNLVRGDLACHHVLVKAEDGQLCGVISSHDLVAAFRHHDMWKHLDHLVKSIHGPPAGQAPPDAEEVMARTRVRDLTKPQQHVFVCEPTDTLKTALRTLLVTQQNFLLVANKDGVLGFITSRDMVKAFADSVPSDTAVGEFLKKQPAEKTHRTISCEAYVIDAAEDMTSYSVDHLVVVRPEDAKVLGVVSSLDIVLFAKAKDLVFRSPSWTGPPVGQIIEEHTVKTALCMSDAKLELVCARLGLAGQTSMAVGIGDTARGIITESDIVHAFVKGMSRHDTVSDLLEQLGEHKVPNYLQIPPNMHLTDAGAVMLDAIEPGRSCHHLVVRSVTGTWVGVFSALDVVRGLHHLPSDLDAAKLGMDALTVGSIMKPPGTFLECSTDETLKDVMSQFSEVGQTAAVVMDGQHALGLITPRCALNGLSTGVSSSTKVGKWIKTRRLAETLRTVTPDTSVMEAAALMCQLNLHHLLVFKDLGGLPVGVLSALDIVRGLVSVHHQRPFLTLGWLRRLGVPTSFAPQARAKPMVKRPAVGDLEEPMAKARRAEESGA